MSRITDTAELIDHIIKRPELYVGNRSFDRVAAFTSGFDFAVGMLSAEGPGGTTLLRFERWLIELRASEQEGIPRNFGWEHYIGSDLSNEEKLRQLGRLFHRFQLSEEARP